MIQERAGELAKETWITVYRPGYFGGKKDKLIEKWDQEYGKGNWRIVWQLRNGEVWDYAQVFWNIYVAGYVEYFRQHPEEARYLTENFSYAYDKDFVEKPLAFDPFALFEKPGKANQFHNVALNLALEFFLGYKFQGREPIQVRQGKIGGQQPAGWKWSPGFIPCTRPDLISENDISGWWGARSIEDFYQKTKVLQTSI